MNHSTVMRNTIRIVFWVAILAGVTTLTACEKLTTEQRLEKLHIPRSNVVRDLQSGKKIYQGACVACHGVDARGTDRGPPLVHRTYRKLRHADMAFHLAVKDGARQHHWNFGKMPPVEGLTPEQVEHVIGYVRSEQQRAGIQ